jgi:hypothetical protein
MHLKTEHIFCDICRECVQVQGWQQDSRSTVVPLSATSSMWGQGEAITCKPHVI